MRPWSARNRYRSTLPEAPAPSLEEVAESSWGPLSDAEARVVRAAERRVTAPVPQPSPHPDSAGPGVPAHAADVRAALLRWLCTDAAASIAARGVQVRGARIIGTLDLESVACPFPLCIEECTVDGAIHLNHAKFPYLRVSDSTVEVLHAVRLRLEGSMLLTGLRLNGELALRGAVIAGNVQLDKALLSCPGGCALDLEGATIGGAVNMRRGFRSNGQIRLFSTGIGKNLECDGIIICARGTALQIESVKIGGSILLRDGFRCLGQVRIYETTLDNTLDMRAARLSASAKRALVMVGCRVKGSVTLDGGDPGYRSRCVGGIQMTRSTIEGHLDLSGIRLRARKWPAADMLDLKIEGRLFARNARICGEMILARAIVRNDVIFHGARLENAGGRALRARGFHCGGSLLLGDRFTAVGAVELFGAFIGDEFNAVGSSFDNPGGTALDMGEAVIQRFVSCGHSRWRGTVNWGGTSIGSTMDLSGARFDGHLRLMRAQVEGDLLLRGAKLGGQAAMQAAKLRCKGSLVMDRNFEALAGADLYGAVVDGDFHSPQATYGDGPARSLVLTRARFGGHVTLAAARLNGMASMEMVTVAGNLSFSNAVLAAPRAGGGSSIALDAGSCVIGGNVQFDEGFRSSGGIRLGRARIAGNLRLTNATVINRRGAALSLPGAAIQGDIDATLQFSLHGWGLESRLLGRLDLSQTSVDGGVDLTGMLILHRTGIALHGERLRVKGALDLRDCFKTNGGIDLREAVVGAYFDSEESWAAARRLRLEGLTYATILPADAAARIRWLEKGQCRRHDPDDEAAEEPVFLQPYEQLIQTLKKQGHDRDGRMVAIAKQAYLGRRLEGMQKWLHVLYGFTMQYGYRPQRALRFAPVFLLVACVLFYSGAESLMVPTNAEAAKAMKHRAALPPGYPSFNAVAYSVEMLVPIVNLQQKEFWRPDDRLACDPGPPRCGYWLRLYLWLHVAAGWIITTLAVAGFSGLVRKD